MSDINEIQFTSDEEFEVAQINDIMRNMQAVNAIQEKVRKERSQPSLEFCEECGDDIPEERRKAVPGVRLCIYCKEKSERR